MNTRDPLYITVIIILLGLLVWMFFENGSTKDTFQRDREIIISNAEKAKVKDDSTISAERSLRALQDAQHQKESIAFKKERSINSGEIKQLKQARDDQGIEPEPITLQIETKYEEQRTADSLEIVRLEQKIFSDSSSFEKEITATNDKYLQQVVISDQHLEHVAELKTDLKKERKRKTGWKIAAIVGFGLFAYEALQ